MARGQVFDRLIPTEKPKRNGFDLSFANNFSTKFGTLTPVLCKEVIPGDTFNIESAFGLKLMPMYFPVQTRMRARLHYFYVRNRNLWKNWKKFLRGDKNVVMPYISGSSTHLYNFFQQGKLSDYLGVPTTMVRSFTDTQVLGSSTATSEDGMNSYDGTTFDRAYRDKEKYLSYMMLASDFFKKVRDNGQDVPQASIAFMSTSAIMSKLSSTSELLLPFTSSTVTPAARDISVVLLEDTYRTVHSHTYVPDDKDSYMKVVGVLYDTTTEKPYVNVTPQSYKYVISLNNTSIHYSPIDRLDSTIFDSTVDFINKRLDNNKHYYLGIVVHGFTFKGIDQSLGFSDIQITNSLINNQEQDLNVFQRGDLRINALPFRAYESIFNAIYRNTQNDPFRINGQVEYDQFNTTLEDGPDSTEYELFQDYWEKDFLTTCLPSPQDGNAPLLGFSSSTQLPNTASPQYLMRYTTEDGSQNNLYVRNNNGVLTFSNAGSHVGGELQGDLDALNSASQFGISINDLRNVNSLQRWLEKNIANGYRYKDIIEAHFGIDISLRELEMPEFIGGVTQDINVNAVTQTSEDGNTPLGWQVGNGSAFGSTKRISKYCDEHGFVIGLLSVVPIPTYSQLLPKMFTKFGQLDYYTPEFAHIGLQPVPYREVCPIQADISEMSMETVFGYNRAFYDYLASTDEVHGEFRGSLRDFLMNRVFSEPPQLSKEFLAIDPAQTNNVFNVTMPSDDKIYGQIYFDIVAERPIPLYNEPRLE